jgi:hypothetical protein
MLFGFSIGAGFAGAAMVLEAKANADLHPLYSLVFYPGLLSCQGYRIKIDLSLVLRRILAISRLWQLRSLDVYDKWPVSQGFASYYYAGSRHYE